LARATSGVRRGSNCSCARRSTRDTATTWRAQRRELPWVAVEKDYTFDTDDGPRTLAELFDGRSQLVVYHFMFGADYEAGCTTCSSIADGFNGVVPHLKARDVTMICVSQAALQKLQAYKRRMSWTFPWVSSAKNDFNFDLGFSSSEEGRARGSSRTSRRCRRSPPATRRTAAPTSSAT
jgi:predicted dithiol-disulfide oxidoreductase (DUF899 family)